MLFFFLYLFLNRYLPENYPKTLRKQIEQKVCMYTPSEGSFVSCQSRTAVSDPDHELRGEGE